MTLSLDELKQARDATIAFYVAGHALRTAFRDTEGTLKPWLFPQLLAGIRRWMAECLSTPGTYPGYLLWRGPAGLAVERIYRACVEGAGGPKELRPILDPYNETGSSRHVRFQTTKTNLYATRADRCQIDRIVLDSDSEQAAAQALEEMPEGPPLRAEREAGLRSAVCGRGRGASLSAGLYRRGGRWAWRGRPAASGPGGEGPAQGTRTTPSTIRCGRCGCPRSMRWGALAGGIS